MDAPLDPNPSSPHRLTRRRTFRERLREVMDPYEDRRDSTRLSLVVDAVVLACILISCTLIVVEMVYLDTSDLSIHNLFWKLEVGFCTIFIVEYLLRWYVAPNRWLYPFTFYAIIDLLAVLPTLLLWGVEPMLLRMVRGLRLLRLARLARLLRLLKLLRYGFLIYRGWVRLTIRLHAIAHQYRLRQLGRILLWSLIAWFVGANVIHVTESRLVGPQSLFADYGQSHWNMTIVLFSGIEDKEPVSLLGRIEMTLMMLTGVVMLSMLTGEIVSIIVRKAHRAGKVALKPPRAQLKQHIVILGINRHLDNVICQVHAALSGKHYLLVVGPHADDLPVTDPKIYQKVLALAGDPSDPHVLEQADLETAIRVIILGSATADRADTAISTTGLDHDACAADNRALMQALAVAARRPQIPMVVELYSEDSLRFAQTLESVEFMLGKYYGERLISQGVLSPGVTGIYDELTTFSEFGNELYTVPVPEPLVGCTFAEAQLAFLDSDDESIVLMGIDRSEPHRPNTHFWLNPATQLSEADRVLLIDDKLIVMAFERPSFAGAAQEDLWNGKILSRT